MLADCTPLFLKQFDLSSKDVFQSTQHSKHNLFKCGVLSLPIDRIESWNDARACEKYANNFNMLLLHLSELEKTQIMELKTTSTIVIDNQTQKVVNAYLHFETKANNIDVLKFDCIVDKVMQSCPLKRLFNIKTQLSYLFVEQI